MGSSRFLAMAGVAWCCYAVSARAQTEPSPVAPAAPAPREADAAPSREQCLARHEQAQDAKLAGKLLTARSALRECSAAACPTLVSRDCVAWLSDVEQQMPSVIFRAVKDGADVVTIRVSEEGQQLTASITGTPLELDPGPHRFVAELPGFPAQSATYVLQAGDKARVVRFDFASPSAATATPAPSPPPPQLWRPIPTVTYVLSGVTLTATVMAGVFGGLALGKRSDVEKECAPLCSARDVSGVKNLALASDISLAVALLGAGATIFTYVTRPSVPVEPDHARRSPASPELHVALNGLGLAAGGRF